MAAVLASGPATVLSHGSAAALWGFGREERGLIEVSLPLNRDSRRQGIQAHRPAALPPIEVTTHERIPVTSPTRTLIDQATRLSPAQLERAINEADKLGRVRADALHAGLKEHRGEPGVAALRALLDPLSFRLSDSELERALRPIARAAGLPMPETKAWVNNAPSRGISTACVLYHRMRGSSPQPSDCSGSALADHAGYVEALYGSQARTL